MRETLDLTVPELGCADEARQIEAALGRLPGLEEVRTPVGSHRTVVTYAPDRIHADATGEAIRELGMTVTDAGARDATRRASLPNLLGWVFVSVVALISLGRHRRRTTRRRSLRPISGSRWAWLAPMPRSRPPTWR